MWAGDLPCGTSDAGFPDLNAPLPVIRNVQPLVGSYSTAPSACHVCTQPSNGGRLGCCYRPICYPCFDAITNGQPSISLRGSPYCTHCKLMRRYFRVEETIEKK